MITYEYLKELNDSGELPKKFTEEELKKIVEAESMMCGFGCSFCPMAQFEFGTEMSIDEDLKNQAVKKEINKNDKGE